MKKKILSVSIAAYNVEKYLTQCLDSILLADLLEDIEVLVIDDGSSDHTKKIAKDYEKKYPGTLRLITKENGGHGSAVNRGIEEACGTYFKPVDGDDWVCQKGFRELVSFLKSSDADLVSTDYTAVQDGTGTILKQEKKNFPDMQYKKTYRFADVCRHVYINMHCSAIRTDILKKMPRRLDEHCFYVDAEYALYPVPYIRTICFLPDPVYMYRLGLSTQSMNIQSMQKNCAHHEKVLNSLLDFYRTEKEHMPEQDRLLYVERGIARILVSQFKIYLSFAPGQKWKQKIMETDHLVREKYRAVYRAVQSPAVTLLRHSHYALYRPASLFCRRMYHAK